MSYKKAPVMSRGKEDKMKHTSGGMWVLVSVLIIIMSSCTPPTQPVNESAEQSNDNEQVDDDSSETNCVKAEPIELWTVRVVGDGCVIRSYSWSFDEHDYDAYDTADREWTWARSYLQGWAVTHNADNDTNYIVEYRRQR